MARIRSADGSIEYWGESFPYGTLAVNLIGCFALGAIAHISQTTELIPVPLRQGITIGMLGAFTTFSTFGYDTLELLQGGQWRADLLNSLLRPAFAGVTAACWGRSARGMAMAVGNAYAEAFSGSPARRNRQTGTW